MSIFKYYRYSSNSYNKQFVAELTEPSLESIGDWFKRAIESIKSLLNKVKEYIFKIGKSIYNGILKMFELLFKRKDKDKKICEVLLNEDILKVYRKVLTGYNGRTLYFTKYDKNKKIQVIDIDDFNKRYDKIISYLTDKDHIDRIQNRNDEMDDIIYEMMLYSRDGVDIKYKNDVDEKLCQDLYNLINPNNIKSFYSQLKYDIPRSNVRCQNRINEIEKEYDKLIQQYKRNQSDDDFLNKKELMYSMRYNLDNIMKINMIKFKIYQSIIGFYRMVSYELNTGFAFSEPCPKGLKLYHLSMNNNLGHILEPRTPESTIKFKNTATIEILPKRISFAPTIEGCYYGMVHWIEQDKYTVNPINENEAYIDINVYNAILDDGSMKIKDIYMRDSVADYNLTKEVALTTDTYIKSSGVVRIYVDGRKSRKYTDNAGRMNVVGGSKILRYEFI